FPTLKRRNTEAKGEQILRRSIVQFPGNTPAFFVLNVEQAQRKGSKFFFGDLQLCNIGGSADELFGAPISPSRKYGCTPMDPTPFSVLMPQSENVLEDFAVPALHVLGGKARKLCQIVGMHGLFEELVAHAQNLFLGVTQHGRALMIHVYITL